MNDQVKYQLLKIIAHNGNILELSNHGYEFGQITFFIDALKNEDAYVEYDSNNRMVVSSLGQGFIKGFEANSSIRTYSRWVLPRAEMWRKPVDKFSIYISKM